MTFVRLDCVSLIASMFVLCFGLSPAYAQHSGGGIQSGTGFFVSNTGHVITNEHVVRGCDQVTLRGTVAPTAANVIATDAEHDLALLKTAFKPSRVALLRNTDKNIFVNDQVLVIGYPLNSGMTGIYKVKPSYIVGLKGPQGQPHWIQFNDALLQGNSGGPLLDASGNVLGVVVGKAKLKRKNTKTGKDEVFHESDVAISLPVLKQFLHDNRVYFRSNMSNAYYSLEQVEYQARQYIVNIHCSPDI